VFRGSEMPRLLSLLTFLAVLALLFVRARDPSSWQWLAEDHGQAQKAETAPCSLCANAAPQQPKPTPEQVTDGPTDEDRDQQAEAAEEFQVITDGSLGIQSEEAFAYWRLLLWTEHQSRAQLESRAKKNPSFGELMQFPRKYRARPVRLDLNVRRVLEVEAEEDNPLGVKHLYEIWGFTDDSKAWLYVVVTAHLPEGMPIGAEVDERARFAGYFFKLQGYYEAGAKPRAPPMRAPLLIGRLEKTSPTAQPAPPADCGWGCTVVSVVVLLTAAGLVIQAFAGRRAIRRRLASKEQTTASVRDWLREDFARQTCSGDENGDE
jgi:hypothetical protein